MKWIAVVLAKGTGWTNGVSSTIPFLVSGFKKISIFHGAVLTRFPPHVHCTVNAPFATAAPKRF